MVSHSADRLGVAGRIPVTVLGATGTVGQRFLSLLDAHPWFEVALVAASERSAGRPYAETTTWIQDRPIPTAVHGLEVVSASELAREGHSRLEDCPLVFSALDASVAGELEAGFRDRGHVVVSNASSHRMASDVPLLVPEVNADHLDLAFGGSARGAILTNPNCSTIGLVLALKPLWDAFGIEAVSVVTMQAISGAGLPGISSYVISDNVVPHIGGEEEKLEREPHKILGRLTAQGIEPAQLTVSAQCNRVPVVDGHTLSVSVKLRRNPREAGALIAAWQDFRGLPQQLGLPTAPLRPVHYLEDAAAPQPRLHRLIESGMAASVGQLKPCGVLDWRFVTLSHNTVRGAAGGALLVAELAAARGLVPGVPGLESHR